MARRTVRVMIGLAALLVACTGAGCSSIYQSKSRASSFDTRPATRSGAGDSLGNALFQHHVRSANATKLRASTSYAADVTGR